MFLNCHSWFSLKYGILSPQALLEEAAKAGVRAMALTDIHCTAGIPDFVRLAEKGFGIRPVAGIEFRQGARLLYIGIAKDNDGFQRLNELLSPHLLDGVSLPEHPPELDNAFFILPFATPHRRLRPNERIGIRPAEVTRLPFSPWARHAEGLVALMPVTFGSGKADRNTHRLLRTMDRNTVLSLLPNEELAQPDERFRTAEEARSAYQGFPALLQNAQRLLDNCSIAFDGSDKTPPVVGSSAQADQELLGGLARAGLQRRYGAHAGRAESRLQRELETIATMGFNSYFLINHDIVSYARRRGFFHVGRGSGANSLVAYCLGITDVDPVELDLYFERFISTARKKPPDFDIDFSWKDRDEIYRYVFTRYNEGKGGHHHVAQLATYATFQWRAAVREIGKALGLPPGEIEALSEGGTGHYGRGRPSATAVDQGLDRVARTVVRYAHRLLGMPHHLSIHVGGVLVSERPMTRYSALHRPPKGFPVTQFSMLEAEDLGLHKFDLLSQRGLGHIRDCVELVNRAQGAGGSAEATGRRGNSAESCAAHEAVDIHDIERFKQDASVQQLLRTGNTIGCFYVESPAMRMLLKKLKVDDYLGLVAASSIIRPGVAESGMMREYLLRHNDPERRRMAPRSLLRIMPETYGVMVYQEDVLRVAHLYAGLSLDDADMLRRGMSARFRDRPEFKEVADRFFAGCRAKGHPEEEAREVWRQIESFASFSFAKGHSASYAVESYQSLWLKAHHPLEFMVAVANNFGGFYRTEFYLHEARRAGAAIEAPCINTSGELCTLVRDGFPLAKPRIHLGLGNIRSLPTEAVALILGERRRQGPFADLQDLLQRVPLHADQARALIRAGALRFTGKGKPRLLWDLTLLHRPSCTPAGGDLFTARVEEPRLPALEHHPLADAFDELELLGFPLCDPFDLVAEGHAEAPRPGVPRILAREMAAHAGRRVEMLGYMIHVKSTTTSAGSLMSFGSFIDPAGDFWDSTQFPDVAAKHPFGGRGVYRLAGIVEEEFGHYALRTTALERLPWKPDPRYGS